MSNDRVALLLSHLEPPRRDEVRAIDDLDALLDQHLAVGFAAWPDVVVETEVYVKHLAGRLRARSGELAERVIRTMPAADLYLAAGCAEGDAAALTAFRDALLPTLRHALAKLGALPTTVDETIQRVLVMLFVGEAGPPQILTYGGRGTLRRATLRDGHACEFSQRIVRCPVGGTLPMSHRDRAISARFDSGMFGTRRDRNHSCPGSSRSPAKRSLSARRTASHPRSEEAYVSEVSATTSAQPV